MIGERMKTLAGKFTFAVPEGHAEAGKKIEKAFEYQECENDTEATQVLTEKKMSITDLVNDKLKANARSNSYQAALLPYRPSEVTPEEIKERMVRDFIRLGVAEDVARTQVESLLASQK
jgi:deoxyxylulose-5-phosphate synthase